MGKGKVDKRHDRQSTDSVNRVSGLIAIMVLVVGVIMYSSGFNGISLHGVVSEVSPSDVGLKSKGDIEKSGMTASLNSKGEKKQANYHDYIAMATANDWSPTDPIEKLLSIISQFKSISSTFVRSSMRDEGSATKSKQKMVQQNWKVFQFHQQEMEYLLNVLRQPLTSTGDSSKHQLDVSELYFAAADNLQKCVYSHMKFMLSEASEGLSVSKEDVERSSGVGAGTAVSSKLCYFPMHVLLSLAGEVKADRSTGGRALGHLHVNFEADTDGTGKSGAVRPSLLEVVVRNRLGRVLPGVAELCSTVHDIIGGGMRAAILNGDDWALGMLIRLLYRRVFSAHQHAQRPSSVEDSFRRFYSEHRAVITSLSLLLSSDANPNSGLNSSQLIARFAHELTEPLEQLSLTDDALLENLLPPAVASASFEASNSVYMLGKGASPESVLAGGLGLGDGVSADTGGFTAAGFTAPETAFPRCDVERLDMSAPGSVLVFADRFVKPNRPVILFTSAGNQAVDSGNVYNVAEEWRFDSLLRPHGALKRRKFSTGAIPYSSLFGLERSVQDASLPAYVRYMRNYTDTLFSTLGGPDGGPTAKLNLEELMHAYSIRNGYLVPRTGAGPALQLPRYLFDNSVLKEAAFYPSGTVPASPLEALMPVQLRSVVNAVKSVVKRKGAARRSLDPSFLYQWFLGPALSGAPFHSHAPAFNVLLYGQKLWHLLPPAADVYSNKHPLASLVDERAGLSPHRSCAIVQNAGDVLYVPRHVSHSVLNLRETVGYAVEVSDY